MGEERPLALPPLSFVALRDYLVHAFFYSTAVHELLGNVMVDVTIPTLISTRILPRRFFSKGRPPQATVQDWFGIVCITAATTCVAVPKLMPEMERQALIHESAGLAAEAGALRAFVADLEQISARITERQKGMSVPPSFSTFDPKNFKVSASL